MSRPQKAIPSYRVHSSGQAIVTVRLANGSRKDILLGKYGTVASKEEYHRICLLLEANGGVYVADSDLTIAEVILAYVEFATNYYGKASDGLENAKRCLKTVRELYGPTPAIDFGPKSLKIVQDRWVEQGLTRKSINKMTGTVKRAFRWLVSEELLPAESFQSLQAVEGLRRGRTAAPDNPPVTPANPADLAKALAFMPPMIAAVCQLQALSGARCGELVSMKAVDVDCTESIWKFKPTIHKGSWRGKGRTIHLGPEAQVILAPLLQKAGDGYVFSPTVSELERIAVKAAGRKTPRWPSHMTRNALKRVGKKRIRPWGERYTTSAVRTAIGRACDAADVPRFTPHQLRHLAALTIREQFGIDHARAVLGHTVASMTEHYSRAADTKLASEVVARIG